jgi:hypothetical protein
MFSRSLFFRLAAGLVFASKVFAADWTVSLVDATGGLTSGQYVSLALDRNGSPHMGYYSYTQGLKYASFDGAHWVTTVVTASGGFEPSMSLDAYDRPSISFSGNNLRYAFYDGGAWTVTNVEPGGPTAGGRPLLSIKTGCPLSATSIAVTG